MEKGWLMSSTTSVSVNSLPQWMGQVPLKSVVIERVSASLISMQALSNVAH